MKSLGIAGMKFPATTSLSTNALDLCRGFPPLKAHAQDLSIKYKDVEPTLLPSYMPELTRFLNKKSTWTKNSRDLLLKFFSHADEITMQTLTPKVLRKGHKMAGFSPFNAEKIMGMSTTWKP